MKMQSPLRCEEYGGKRRDWIGVTHKEARGFLGRTFQAEDTHRSDVIDARGPVGWDLTKCHKDCFSVR